MALQRQAPWRSSVKKCGAGCRAPVTLMVGWMGMLKRCCASCTS